MKSATSAKESSTSLSEKRALLGSVALLYYGEGLTQQEIAKRLDVARTTVVNMLRDARELGIVDIRVDGESLRSSRLASKLCEALKLEDVYVARTLDPSRSGSDAEMMRQLGRVSAIAMRDILRPGDNLGVAWGLPIQSLAEHLRSQAVEDISVLQMIGSISTQFIPASEKCTIDIANKLGAVCYTLHAPALVSSAEVARILHSEPTIRAQLDALQRLDVAVVSIGNVSDNTPMVQAGMVTEAELASAQEAGAAGILCCRFIDANGDALDLPPTDRILAARLEDIRRASRRLLVVGGPDRLEATLAAIKGGYVTHLCIEEKLALSLWSALGNPSKT